MAERWICCRSRCAAKGLLPPFPREETNPRLAEYLHFLSEHCGLSAPTIARQRADLERLLRHLRAWTDAELSSITVKDIDECIIEMSRTRSRRSMESIGGTLRGFPGHLFVRGVIPIDLRSQVLMLRLDSLESLPRSIPWREVWLVRATARLRFRERC